MLRDPEGRLRLSNPALLLLGWMFYYFIKPAIAWLQGSRMALESPGTVVLDVSVFAQVQHAHCYLAMALFAVLPRRADERAAGDLREVGA
ncbi:MAG: hypothetical protein R3A48_19940 [Polyangiales bacterium]